MLAEIPDLEGALGRQISESEVPKAVKALRDADYLARIKAPWLVIGWETTVPQNVTDAVASLAARKFSRRIDGLVAIGPFRYAEKTGEPDYFTPDELGMIGIAADGQSTTLDMSTPDES